MIYLPLIASGGTLLLWLAYCLGANQLPKLSMHRTRANQRRRVLLFARSQVLVVPLPFARTRRAPSNH